MITFLFKRVIILCAALAVIAFFLTSGGWFMPLGIMLGGCISIYKLRLQKIVLTTLSNNGKSSFFVMAHIGLYMFNALLVFMLLYLAIQIDLLFFFGMAAGLLSTMVIICVYAFNKKMRLTNL